MFAEGLSRKAMVTAAALGVSLGDEAPTEACRARQEGMMPSDHCLPPPVVSGSSRCARGNCSYWDVPPTLSLGFSFPNILLKVLLKDNVEVNPRFSWLLVCSGWLSADAVQWLPSPGKEPERSCYRWAPGWPGGPSSKYANNVRVWWRGQIFIQPYVFM